MNTQPEALRLADALQRAVKQLDPEDHVAQIADWFLEDAAAELRRLHALNVELLEALRCVRAVLPTERWGYDMKKLADAAIAKAEAAA